MVTLKAARINAGLTQVDAANLLGIDASTLGNYERGKYFPDVPLIMKIENLYGIAYADIFFKPNYDLIVSETITEI